MTGTAVGSIIASLADAKLIEFAGRTEGQRGQPASLIRLDPRGAFGIGVHLDRMRIETALVNFAGDVLGRRSHDTLLPPPADVLEIVRHDIDAMQALLPDHERAPDRYRRRAALQPRCVDARTRPRTRHVPRVGRRRFRGRPRSRVVASGIRRKRRQRSRDRRAVLRIRPAVRRLRLPVHRAGHRRRHRDRRRLPARRDRQCRRHRRDSRAAEPAGFRAPPRGPWDILLARVAACAGAPSAPSRRNGRQPGRSRSMHRPRPARRRRMDRRLRRRAGAGIARGVVRSTRRWSCSTPIPTRACSTRSRRACARRVATAPEARGTPVLVRGTFGADAGAIGAATLPMFFNFSPRAGIPRAPAPTRRRSTMSRSELPRPLLEMRGISKTFPAVRALDNVSLTVYPGEIHSLMAKTAPANRR